MLLHFLTLGFNQKGFDVYIDVLLYIPYSFQQTQKLDQDS